MTLRIEFFGAGFIARHHARMLRGVADARIASVLDPDPARVESFVAETGARAATDEAELLSACDAVYICTWTAEHRRLVEAAAAAGTAVFCEKPLATGLADAEAMVDAVWRAGVVNQVGLVLRDYPAMRLLRELVADPANGRVMSVLFRDDQYLPTQGIYESTWRGDATLAGAGTLLEHSIHDLDALEWLVGPVVSVAGRSADFHALDGIEDVAVASLRFATGSLGSLVSVWHDVLSRPSLRRIEVFCEHSWLALEGDFAGPVRWTGPDGQDRVVEGDELVAELETRGVSLRNPDEAFVAAVVGGEPARPDFKVALRAHELVDAFYRSAAAGGVPLDVS